MGHLTKILSGIGILIGLYLVLSKGTNATKLISGVMDSAVNGIKVLQGRWYTMGHITKILGGIGTLIAIYLFLSKGTQTVKIINSVSSNMLSGIQVLQGREKIITDN